MKKVAEGQSVVLDCEVTGKPDPIVTWYRDTSLITGGRFKIMPSGNLLIEVWFFCVSVATIGRTIVCAL